MTVSEETWRHLLAPYVDAEPSAELLDSLDLYLQLLLRWNQRMNLTAVREPERMIQRHFGESLFAARYVPRGTSTLLDHGSGAGFPGLPIALVRPEIAVTVSDAQTKKAAFLREAVRELRLPAQVFAGRTEDLPSDARFDCVTMRAVEHAAKSVPTGAARVAPAGTLFILGKAGKQPFLPEDWALSKREVPNSSGGLWICRQDVLP